MPPRPKSKRTASLPAVVKNDKQPATRPVMLLVLGPHRSGTSLTTRMLECLDANLSGNLMPPTPGNNEKGFFEDMDVYRFNESHLLPRLGLQWQSVTSTDWSKLSKADRSRLGLQALEILRRNYPLSNHLSVLKEPRINNTLPFWLSLLEHAGFNVRIVCVLRDPVSVARSLLQRDTFSLAHGGMIYLTSWLSVLPHLQERQVAFVQFDEIFVAPGKVLAKVADKLGLPLPPDFDQCVHAFTSEHLDPSMRHSTLPREDVMLEPDLPPLVAELYRVLLDAAQSQNIRKTAKFLTYAERQIENLAPLLADYDAKQSKLSSLKTEYDNAQTECAHLQSQLTDSTQQSQTAVVAERDAVTAERDALAARVSSLESAHSSLSTLHSSLVAERDGLTTRLSSLESEHSSLSTLHSSLIAERDDLVTRHTSLATALEELQGQHSSLVTERDALHSDHSSLVAERDALLTRHTSLVTALENLQGQHSSLIAERDDLVTRHQQLATALESLQSQHSSLNAEREALATRVAALESELTDGSYELQTKLLAERNSLSRTIKERDGATRERDQFSAKLIKLEREHHALARSEHSLKIAHRKLEERFARANAALALLKNAQDEATSLRTALASLRAENDKVAKDRDRHAARLSALEAERAKLVTRHSSLATAFEELQSQHSSLSTHHSSLNAERNELVTALEQLQGQHSSLMAQGDDHVAELEKAGERIRDLEENIQDRFRELAELTKCFILAEDSRQQTASEHDNLVARLSSLESEHSSLSNLHSSLVTDHASLSTLHSSLIAERNDLATRHSSLLSELNAVNSKRNRLSYDIDARFNELAVLSKRIFSLEQELQDARCAARDCGDLGCIVDETLLTPPQDKPPYRHLQFHFRGVRRPERHIQKLRFRLVEHHGRPGLCLFSPAGEPHPLDLWVQTGEEAGDPYMLVIPSNKSGTKLVKDFTEADAALIQTILAAADRALRAKLASSNNTSFWAQHPLHDWLTRARLLAESLRSASGNSKSRLAFFSAAR